MINKENKTQNTQPQKQQGAADLVSGRVEAHIIIRDKDTKRVIVNQRG